MSTKLLPYFRTISVGLLLSAVLFSQSCSNRETAIEEIGSGERAQLIVNIEGVVAEAATSGAQASVKTTGTYATLQPQKEISFNESIKALTSVTQQPIEQNTKDTKLNTTAATVQLPTKPMTKDYTYRIIMYKADGSFFSSTDLSAGTAGSIHVYEGQTYKWYAYSYNNSAAIPAITDNQNPTIATAVNKDLLYASGEVTIGTSPQGQMLTQNLPITFEHKMSKISLAINARGMNATIKDNIVVAMQTPVSFSQGNLNLKTGVMQANGSVNYAIGDPITFQNSTDYGNAIKEAFFYTIQSTGALSLSFKHNTIDVKYSDNTEESLIAPSTSLTSNFSVTPVPGKNTNLNIILYKIGGTIDGVTWASGNLGYENGQPVIRPSDLMRATDPFYTFTDYWFGRASAPGGTADQVDPCTKVFPENTWRLPTRAEFQILVNKKNDPSTQYDGNGIVYSVSFLADGGKRVNFNPDGRRTMSGENIINPGTNGFYWTSTRRTGNQFYAFQTGRAIASNVPPHLDSYYTASGNRLTIRCVRNK
ncbi:hypothetical protein [Elizabethkingia anophelis]|uniref:hypothetical protein n=1 Tax=Elizabethkingia anophelis TaxID=1117645 RepID=UPI00301BFF4C